jgi:hypothetical protein
MDFVPSGSQVTCGVECKHIWIGAKGWGITWALKQCVVIPKLIENSTGKLMLDISEQEKHAMTIAPPPSGVEPEDEDVQNTKPVQKEEVNTYVENSDDEAEPEPEQALPIPPTKKTVVKKTEKVPETQSPPEVPAGTAVTKKKVVRKKAT